MKLLLSITKNGLISLWDTPEQRDKGAFDERFVDLELTPKQVMLLEKGNTVSKRSKVELRMTLGE
jgi:hypothetical protein